MAYSVAIDGPAGAGKSTIAKLISKEMGYIYVDTGAMYRAMAVYFTKNNIDPDDENAINAAVDNVDISIEYQNGEQQVILNGENVTGLLRTEETGNMASRTSKYKEVRSKLVVLQRKMSEKYNVIMDGRDIGTVVLKDSKFKFFLTATPEERARRRFTELVNRGIDVNYDKLLEDIIKRDYIDSHREVDPLKKADDAIEIDSSNYNINEVTEIICNFIENALQ